MAGKQVGVDQDEGGRNFHLILNLKSFLFKLLGFGLKSASQCQTFFLTFIIVFLYDSFFFIRIFFYLKSKL